MRWVLVLEDMDESFDKLSSFIEAIDNQIVVKRFHTLEEFSIWFGKVFLPRNEEEDEDGDDNEDEAFTIPDEIALLVCNHRILGPPQDRLITKVSTYFKSKKLLGERSYLPVLFLIRESEGLDLEPFRKPHYHNILYKPYDRLVCLSKLRWALVGSDALKSDELYKETPQSPIEMLKDARISHLSETGFVTTNARPITGGSVAKYYGSSAFNVPEGQGVFARSVNSRPNPQNPNEFFCDFEFYGLSNAHIRKIREKLEAAKAPQTVISKPSTQIPYLAEGNPGFIIIDHDKVRRGIIKEQIQNDFSSMGVVIFSNIIDFLLELDPAEGARQLAELTQQESDADSLVLTYEPTSEGFVGAIPALPDTPTVFGIPKEKIPFIKTHILASLPEARRKSFMEFWTKPHPNPPEKDEKREGFILDVVTESGKRVLSLTLHKEKDKKDRELLHLTLRLASATEIEHLMKDHVSLPEKVYGIFVNEVFATKRQKEFWDQLRGKIADTGRLPSHIKTTPIYCVLEKPLELYEKLEQVGHFDDCFNHPIDRKYLSVKLCKTHRVLEPKSEAIQIHEMKVDEKIQIGNPVDATKVSETSVTISYSREMDPNTFRWFTFWSAEKRRTEKFLARFVESEKDPDRKGRFLNHLTFFGLGDVENQFVRHWLLEQYKIAKGKEKDS